MDINALNSFYKKLDTKACEIINTFNQNYELKSTYGYYNGHYYMNNGEYEKSFFPIPVIDVKNLCNIEINPHFISITAKLGRENAMTYNYDKLKSCKFEVYGVENYLKDFYKAGQPIDELLRNIERSSEKEIGFSFEFSKDAALNELYLFALFLKKECFYY